MLRVIAMVGVTFSIIILSILTGLGFNLFFNYAVLIAVLCGFWLAAIRLLFLRHNLDRTKILRVIV